jgi:hypothetical protein
MKTLNLYEVTFENTVGEAVTINVAAEAPAKAKKQTTQYSKSVTKVTRCKRVGNVNVPVVVPAGL